MEQMRPLLVGVTVIAVSLNAAAGHATPSGFELVCQPDGIGSQRLHHAGAAVRDDQRRGREGE
jgi:hypothetical protein